MELLERKIYFEKIKPYVDKNIIKVIVGQRRIGKSTFLQWLANYYAEKHPTNKVVYINKEDISFDTIKDYKDLIQYAQKHKSQNGKTAIIIDEIQEINQFEKAIRHLHNSNQWDIYCTGSNASLLSGELATLLSGRYIEILMFGLSYPEFLKFHKLRNTAENFQKYCRYGGLPFLINLELDDKVVFDFLKNIYSTILFKDILARYNVRNVAFLEKLTVYLADNVGNIFSARKISEYLKTQSIKISTNIVLDYLSYLSNAFFVYKVSRYDLKGKRILEIGEKYYFSDLGIRHSLVGYKQTDIAQILENIVFIHLLIYGFDVKIGKIDDKEIDFVCSKGEKIVYIQVTLSLADEKVKEREIGNLLRIEDNFRKIVVTADEVDYEYKGVEIVNIRKFLTEFV